MADLRHILKEDLSKLSTESVEVWPAEWRRVLPMVCDAFQLDLHDIHGLPHWTRVLINGMELTAETGANENVLIAFALFHDCQRWNDDFDPEHGSRGAEFGRKMRQDLPSLSDIEFDLFHFAATHHSDGFTEGDVSVQTCWDADRLDLYRVAVRPCPKYLCTDAAKKPEQIELSVSRSIEAFHPA